MSQDNGRHVRAEDLAPHLEPASVITTPSEYDGEHARGRFHAGDYPITVHGAEQQVHARELELAYARGVLVKTRETRA